jgi:adenylate kinase
MITCLTETRESYDQNIIVELSSDGSKGENELEDNVRRIGEWVEKWREDRLAGRHDNAEGEKES